MYKHIIFALLGLVTADVPVSCPYASTLGTWEFFIGTSGIDQSLVAQCGLDNLGPVTSAVKFLLEEKSKVTNLATGSVGTYTIVSSNGFEIYIDGARWWGYYYFQNNGEKTDCTRTMVGYVRYDNMKQWNCIQGRRLEGPSFSVSNVPKRSVEAHATRRYQKDDEFIAKVNKHANWQAKHYNKFEAFSLAEFQSIHGHETNPEWTSKFSNKFERIAAAKNFQFPDTVPATGWDWRNIDGQNFDSPVWDQSSCGSCFAFSAKTLMESRVRVASGNTQQPIISVQEIITCGSDENYNQRCNGGFAYLAGGKEGYERGMIEESCDNYNVDLQYDYKNGTCPTDLTKKCPRYFATDYQYLGGFYGAATVDIRVGKLNNL